MFCINSHLFNAAWDFFSGVSSSGRVYCTILEEGITNPALKQYVRNGVLTLNISPRSAQIFSGKEGLEFSGSFGGKIQKDFFTWDAVFGIYSPEKLDTIPPYGFPKPVWIKDGSSQETQPDEEPKPTVEKRNPFTVIEGGKE